MTRELVDFFLDKAYAYTHGQLRYMSGLFFAPCELSIGSQVKKIADNGEIMDIFAAYRQNLTERGYAKTSADVLHATPFPDGSAQCLVTYTNLNSSGQPINVEHASYILRRTDDGFLRISCFELLDEPNPELFAGAGHLLA